MFISPNCNFLKYLTVVYFKKSKILEISHSWLLQYWKILVSNKLKHYFFVAFFNMYKHNHPFLTSDRSLNEYNHPQNRVSWEKKYWNSMKIKNNGVTYCCIFLKCFRFGINDSSIVKESKNLRAINVVISLKRIILKINRWRQSIEWSSFDLSHDVVVCLYFGYWL